MPTFNKIAAWLARLKHTYNGSKYKAYSKKVCPKYSFFILSFLNKTCKRYSHVFKFPSDIFHVEADDEYCTLISFVMLE